MKHRAFIIGLGNIGMMYDYNINKKDIALTHANALSNNKNFTLVGAYDNDLKKRKLFEKKFKLKTYCNLSLSILSLKPDLIVISTSTNSHLNVLIKILSIHIPKIILCEKPLSYKIIEAKKIVNLCKNNNIKLFVNYVRNFDQKFINIKKNILNFSYKLPVRGCVWYTKGFIHNGSHIFNLFEHWFGKYISSKLIIKRRSLQDYDVKNDYIINFRNANIYFLWSSEKYLLPYFFDLFFSNGRLNLNADENIFTWKKNKKKLSLSYSSKISRYSDNNKYQSYVYNKIYNINKLSLNMCTGQKALTTLIKMKKIIKNDE